MENAKLSKAAARVARAKARPAEETEALRREERTRPAPSAVAEFKPSTSRRRRQDHA